MSTDSDEITIELDTSKTLVIPSKAMGFWLLLFLLIFGAGMIYVSSLMYADPEEPKAIAIFCGLVGALMFAAPVGLWYRQMKGHEMPHFILSPEGFGNSVWQGKTIPWQAVNGINFVTNRYTGLMMTLHLEENAMQHIPMSKLIRQTQKVEKYIGLGNIAIMERQIAFPLEAVHVAILKYAADHAQKEFAITALNEITTIQDQKATI